MKLGEKSENGDLQEASYNECKDWLLDDSRLQELVNEGWILEDDEIWRNRVIEGLKRMYPNRTLSPLLRREDCDDRLCATMNDSMRNEIPVILIHDYASEGWENHGIWNSIEDWFSNKINWKRWSMNG